MMKTIIITGAANGVGKAIAELYQGQELILIDNDSDKLVELAKRLNANYYDCDIADAEAVSLLLDSIKESYPKIDILVNNAGMWIAGSLSELETAEFAYMNEVSRIRQVIDTNLFGLIAMTSGITPIMIKQGYGQIININSQSGVKTEEPYPIYNASKTGVTAFRKAVQTDLAKANIRITDVHPGLIDTDFYLHAKSEIPRFVRDLGLKAEDVANVVKYLVDLPENISIPSIEMMDMKSY